MTLAFVYLQNAYAPGTNEGSAIFLNTASNQGQGTTSQLRAKGKRYSYLHTSCIFPQKSAH